ncbi:PucR family transcriptional regulator [Nocardia alba]|uniref:PucR-like helix-turn-helix protein n=1 Tax=Nocardia alba TaxID=225051 RepID=A0A4R1FS20_9NOCA|nr:helix-turn-helix domain-containing protein [Nocardia alba]TCJ96382.1 PucR-like helix-turn-helix protein [Nocardia alba]
MVADDSPVMVFDEDRRAIAGRIAAIISEVDPELDDIAADLTRLYRDSIPVYDQVDPDSIEHNTRLVLRIVVGQMRAESSHTGFRELSDLARIWADQRIPLELVAHSIQLGARRIFELIRRRAAAQQLPAALIDQMQNLTWEWATASATAVHMVLQQHAVTAATRRADFLRRLLDGNLPPALLTREAGEHRLDPARHYRVACTRWSDTAPASDLLAALRAHAATPEHPVVHTVVDNHLIALLPRYPREWSPAAPVALGPAVPLTDAHTSYRHALRILHLATRFDRHGLLDPTALGPLPLLDCAETTAEALHAKHLAPLNEHGGAATEITATVETYLDCDRRIDDTASALHLHRNTVRNRITRFGELTGLDLDHTEDLVLTWWLLKRNPPIPPTRSA